MYVQETRAKETAIGIYVFMTVGLKIKGMH